ncbi:MAG: 4'-phosphopantetheinyl transferase family protein [Eubacterium sp.]
MNYDFEAVNINELLCGDFDKQLSEISFFRRERVNSYSRQEDKNLCLAASLLLGRVLGRNGICEKELSYAVSDNGKPYFSNLPNIHFSISHSGEYAAACIADREIGCDIQKITDVDLNIAKRFFTEKENEYISACQDKKDAFFRLWVFKESLAKATGRGLVPCLSSVEIHSLEDKPFAFFENEKYLFFEKDICNGCKCAVCVKE